MSSLIVIDGARGIGNGRVIPAGPLRAPLSLQCERTDALLIVGDGNGADAVAARISAKGAPVLRGHFAPDPASVEALRGRPVLAFAGIGDPDRFFATLRASGIEVAVERPFPDHHPFSADDIAALLDRGAARRLDPGDHREGSGAARRSAAACRGGADRAAGDDGAGGRGRLSPLRDRAARRRARPPVSRQSPLSGSVMSTASPRGDNAAAAPRSARHRLP